MTVIKAELPISVVHDRKSGLLRGLTIEQSGHSIAAKDQKAAVRVRKSFVLTVQLLSGACGRSYMAPICIHLRRFAVAPESFRLAHDLAIRSQFALMSMQ